MHKPCPKKEKMKVNYLNNRDLLLEIHKSKTTYCSFINQIDNEYDIIIHDAALILDHETMQQGRKLRADRLARQAFDMAKSKGEAVKAAQFAMTPEQISPDDVVFRLMTKAHIPEMELKVLEGAELNELLDIEDADILPIKYVKVNFPPFQHFKVVPHMLGAPMPDTAVCVGKSHWKGDLVTGEYCREHGAMTKKLANMFMKLCERYATRSNWRGYTYNDEMRCQALLQLSQIGLQFDESKSQNPFAYFTSVISNSFTRVLNIEKRNQNIRDDILEMNGMNPSYTRQNSGSNIGGGYEE